MILFFQLPLTDVRAFISGYTGKISVPLWPHPIFSASNSNQDSFVRQFGKIKPRRKGGVQGWLGEDELCDAKNAIRIQRINPFISDGYKLHIQGRARHFFFDGHALGKYEFVFVTTKSVSLSTQSFFDFIDYFLNIQVAPANDKTLITPLYLAGNNLAKEYLTSTTKLKSFNKIISEYWVKRRRNYWVNSGAPVLFIECQSEETEFPINPPKKTQVKKIPLPLEYNADLFHILYPIDNRFIRIWLLKRRDNVKSEKLRTLRLYIMRLNAEYENVKYVLSQIDEGRIRYKSGDKNSKLEFYLNETTRHISRIENSTIKIAATDEIEILSKLSFDKVYPGSSDSILTKIKSMRPQIYKKVETLVQEIYNIQGDINMGDKINLNGDFRGANVNVKSILQDVAINIQNATDFDESAKQEIESLINRLEQELQQAPPLKKDDAQAVSTMAKRLIETATQEKPNKTEVKISAESLIKAAQNLASVLPIVLVIAKQLISLVVK